MTVNYKLDKTFGPAGTSAGIFMCLVGLLMLQHSLVAVILVIIGSFVGFTYTSTFVDFDKKRLKFSNNLFGILPTGDWIYVNDEMRIGVRKSNKSWKNYSRSNRTLETSNTDFRLILYNSKGQAILTIQKFDNLDSANLGIIKMSKLLGLTIF